jgi:hypothetical protein
MMPSSPHLRGAATALGILVAVAATVGTDRVAEAGAGDLGSPRYARHVDVGSRARTRAQRTAIGNFAARKRLEARQALRREALEREHARRLAELRDGGDRLTLEHYRRESRATELHNALVFRHELEQLDALLAREQLGPVTRRVLDRHRAGLLERQHRLERDRALEDVQRELDAAEAKGEATPWLGARR